MRQNVNAARIEEFLHTLGKEVNFACTLYLVGGTSLVYFGLRNQTIDIDLSFEVGDKYHQDLINIIRRLKEKMDLNVEEANPGDFIPLPSGWKERSIFIRRFGSVDVFHFDLYSVALSKIERGNEVDLEDVVALVQNGKISWETLRTFYEEILPQMGKQSLKQDPARFQRNFDILKEKLNHT